MGMERPVQKPPSPSRTTKKRKLGGINKGPGEFRKDVWGELGEVCAGEAGREEDFSEEICNM